MENVGLAKGDECSLATKASDQWLADVLCHGVVRQCTGEVVTYTGDLLQGNSEGLLLKYSGLHPTSSQQDFIQVTFYTVQEMDNKGIKSSYLHSKVVTSTNAIITKRRWWKGGGESSNLQGASLLILNLFSAATHLTTPTLIKLQSWRAAAEQRKFCSVYERKCESPAQEES